MALFKGKNNTAEKKSEPKKKVLSLPGFDEFSVILRPRITEKATLKAENENVYVFEVSQKATKKTIEKALKSIYKVFPIRINMAKTPAKNVFIRGKKGVKSEVKKAYVYLKEGEKIEIA